MNCHRFHHMSLFIFIFLLTAPRLLADSVDDYIREQMIARHLPGLVLLVLRDGKVIKRDLQQQGISIRYGDEGIRMFPLGLRDRAFCSRMLLRYFKLST